MPQFIETEVKLKLLEKAGDHLQKAKDILLDLDMAAEAMELEYMYRRNIETHHRFICETELPRTEKTLAYVPKGGAHG